MSISKAEAITTANAALQDACLPTYTELVGLIRTAAKLGSARRECIGKQDALDAQIAAIADALKGSNTTTNADHIQAS